MALASSTEHFHHPGLRYGQFIYCDDMPNSNKQGIEYEDFPDLMASAIGTPVKMKFLGQSEGGHTGSIPIGYIHKMTEESFNDGANHRLIASAILFASEYPDEIQYLEDKFNAGTPPGVSWELSYKDTIVKNGITWLKKILARAATFVRNPAYGSRTALLALATNQSISADDFSTELSAFAHEISPKIIDKGGNNNVEEELRLAKEALAAANARIAELEQTTNAKIETLEQQVTTLTTTVEERDTALAEVALRELIAERTRLISEAGIKIETDAEKLAKKQAFWAQFSEETFAEYLDDLKAAVVKPKEAAASGTFKSQKLPKLTTGDASSDAVPTASDLMAKFKGFRNTNAVSE